MLDPRIEFLEHTGDTGLRVQANSLEDLFSLSAQGLFYLICPKCAIDSRQQKEIIINGNDLEELYVNWLSELNYFFSTKEMLFSRFSINHISSTELHAVASGEVLNVQKHLLHTEIKAVTFHKLYVRETENGWESQVIFDI